MATFPNLSFFWFQPEKLPSIFLIQPIGCFSGGVAGSPAKTAAFARVSKMLAQKQEPKEAVPGIQGAP